MYIFVSFKIFALLGQRVEARLSGRRREVSLPPEVDGENNFFI
jgi:hypothetical protein